ncbi:MAG: hypothetical protein NT038_01650 [Euryarchaeota archaeon]|nr:hypothetical protein [Euryarchaeota archaeon]
MSKETYQCLVCKRTTTGTGKKTLVCCGKPMIQLPKEICLQPAHPEHVRSMDAEEPCDDFREGK